MKKETYPGWFDWITGEEKKEEKECPADKFILELYTKLRNVDEGQSCFLNGAFVIQDEGGKVFDLLTNEKGCKQRVNYRYGAPGFNYITHDIFMNPNKFGKKNNVELDEKFNENTNFLKLSNIPNRAISSALIALGFGDKGPVPIQYEYTLSPALQFLCDKECQILPDNVKINMNKDGSLKKDYPKNVNEQIKLMLLKGQLDNCLENKREKKGIILFYPFQVIITNLSTKAISRKRYLYLKLEEDGQLDFYHWIKAFNTYVLDEKKNDPYPKRRERMVKDDTQIYLNSDLQYQDEIFYVTNQGDIDPELKFYNDNIRIYNEFFVSQKLTNQLLNNIGIKTFDIPSEEGGGFYPFPDDDLP